MGTAPVGREARDEKARLPREGHIMGLESRLLRIGAPSFTLHTRSSPGSGKPGRPWAVCWKEKGWVGSRFRGQTVRGFTSTDELFSASHFLKGSGWTTKSSRSRTQF